MSEVHEIAARGFGAEAAAYDAARPSYPRDAVAWLTGNLGIGPGRVVIDLAAGTGKLTALIAGAGANLIAVEPVRAMADRLRARLPEVPLLAGVAEAIPLAARSADAVVVAQAFHWFDAPRALTELARVVRPGGRLGLIWNARDRSVGWVDQIWSVMDGVERNAPWRDHRDGTGAADPELRRSERQVTGRGETGWSPWTEATFHHVHHSTHDQVIDRMRSVSHIAALPPASRQAVLGEIATILAEHPQTRDAATVAIPYRVDAMYSERLAGQG
jgi:SAM-dependent methyltransferase